MPVTLHARIGAPREIVFEYVRDLEKIPLWVKEVEDSWYTLERDDQAEGTRFVQKIRQGFSLNTYEGEVTGFEQDKLLQVSLVSESAVMDIEYRLLGEGEACEMTYITDMRSRNLRGAFLGMMFQGFSESVLRRQLMTLKRLAEKHYRSTQ